MNMQNTTQTNNKPTALPVQFGSIPLQLRQVPRWVLWSHVLVGEGDKSRWSKLPLQASGRSASSTNPATWAGYIEVEAAYASGKFDGVGFVFDGTDQLVGIDLDDCYDTATNRFTNAALQQIATSVEGYMEVSPSGTGVKLFTLADLPGAHVDHTLGLEVYPKGRYFTVTGHKLSGEIPATPQDLTDHIPARAVKLSGDDFADYSPPVEGYDMPRVRDEVLSQIDPDCGYTDWLTVGMALHHQFSGSVEAQELWDEWSYQDGACGAYTPGACERKWSSFTRKGGATLRSLTFKVSAAKRTVALARGEVVLDGGQPLVHAREFLSSMYASEEGTKLVHYADDFFIHVGTHYEEIEEATIRSHLYRFLEKCKTQDKKGNVVPFRAQPATVTAGLDAIKALTHLANQPNTRPPVWLEGYAATRPPAGKLISLQNGLFHLEDGLLIPHSLGFFTQNSLPFGWEPGATCPEWNKFLHDIWGDDAESIQLLQEFFGYILSGDTRQQKLLNVIGPRRSGKGTINKVLVSLLGQHNTAAPQLEELCDTFGLQPWLGKLLASFTDARAPSRNTGGIVSQLLRIVGGDTVTVNRKNKEAWHGYLPARIVVYSNEALQLAENSNALTGRMMVLKMSNSFYGREDIDLATRLGTELPGIFNWAMEGQRNRLQRDGQRFIQPATGREMLELMEEIGNPIGSFLERVLVFDTDSVVEKDHVFACYKRWALSKNINPGTDLSFKRRFLAATSDRRVISALDRSGGLQRHVYRGVKFSDAAQKFVDSLEAFNEEVF